ncbi:MAG TPA: hypothetical protein VE988_12775, partial [Gemmataceae bacterium]|nr:hypothetical protein [Gemmataceae bacterium]
KAVNIGDDDRGSDKVLVGWNAKADANGNRQVLFLDGSVNTVTDAEFQNMPKVRTVGEKKQNKK